MAASADQHLKALWAEALGHFQAARMADAERAYRRCLALVPDHPGGTYNLAVTLKALGRPADAATQYRRTLALQPQNAKAHNNLGVALAAAGEDAAPHYRRALAIQPDYANAHYNLANLLRGRGETAAAADHYRKALAKTPGDAEVHNNLGLALIAEGFADDAIAHFRRAMVLRPHYAAACSNLGSALEDQGRADEALDCYSRALDADPAHADARFNLAHALDMRGETAAAAAEYELALALDPNHAQAHNGFGLLCERLGRVDEALARYARAQALKPAYADAHWHEALARLLLGDFEQGWRKYAWRWRRKATPSRPLAAPLWDGGDLHGKTILLHGEQGRGDSIQFIRYAPLVQAKGASTVVLEGPKALARLFAGAPGVDDWISAGDPLPPIDVHAPLLSLPGLLGTRLDTIPAKTPYLRVDPDRVQAWRERLVALDGLKVGLVWRGNPAHGADRARSLPPSVIAGLTGVAGISFVSLQQDARADELDAFSPGALYDAGPGLGDWVDTAALTTALDLVVSVDTAVAHLAGALGRPVWLMTPFAPDWRWLLHRDDSPWYPTLRLFRQPAPGEWPPVLAAVRMALGRLADGGEQQPSPSSSAARSSRPRLPPAMVVSHERSGTHFLMKALSYGYGYTAEPWTDLDTHEIDIDYGDPAAIAAALERQAADPLFRLVKSHHAVDVFRPELTRIAGGLRIHYIYRHPGAVMTSLWRHLNGLAWDEGPKLDDPLALARATPAGRLTRYQANPVPNMLRRWADHVEGWLAAAASDPRIATVRYEDLDSHYTETLTALAPRIGRDPLSPMLRPPREAGVIAMGPSAAEAPVPPDVQDALDAYLQAEVGPLLRELGY